MAKSLEGKVAVVAGATRGAGRGIACGLGEQGAIVYCTGRSVRGQLASGDQRPETIEETAEKVTALGGVGIPVRVDHTIEDEVKALGRAVAALAADPDVSSKAGQALATWDLYKEYGFTDADGTQPDIWPHLEDHFKKMGMEEMA